MILNVKMNDGLSFSLPRQGFKFGYGIDKSLILVQDSNSIDLPKEIVAIFGKDRKECSFGEDTSIFFIDRFRKRFERNSQRYIKKYLNKTIFAELINVKDSEIDRMISLWIETHERMHETGDFPLSKYTKEKSYRFSAAFEELRTDIISTSTLLLKGKALNRKAGLLILAERMIGYPLYRHYNDPDTISSILFGLFLDFDFFRLMRNKKNTQEMLSRLTFRMGQIEKRLQEEISNNPKTLDCYIKSMFQNDYLSYYNRYQNYWRGYENCNR